MTRALIIWPALWLMHACEPAPAQPGISCEVIEISPERAAALLLCDRTEIILKESTR